MCLIIIIKLENYSIIMNDVSSLLMATSILAIGGLGLYMYKNADDDDDDDISYNEDTLFEDDNEYEDEVQPDYEDEELEEEIYQPKSKTKGKTKRNRKTTGTKRRR
jgi:hypothetical protein